MPAELSRLLARQDRVLSGRQALAAGFSSDRVRWLVRSGRWQRVHPAVFLTHSGPPSDRQLQWAALLYAGFGAVLACHSAAVANGLVGYETSTVHVVVPWRRRVRPQAGLIVHRSRLLGPGDIHPVRVPPRTRLPRSILDLIDHLGRPDDIRAVLAAGVQQRLVSIEQMRAAVERAGCRKRRALVLATLGDIEGGSHALPELLAMRLLRSVRLPLPDARQKRLADGGYYLDMWWETQRLAVEIDGGLHRLATQWWADLDRQNEIVLGERRILRFPAHVLREHPERFVRQMQRALEEPAERGT